MAQAWTSRLLINAVVAGIRDHAARVAIPFPWGGHAPPLGVRRALVALAIVQFGLEGRYAELFTRQASGSVD